MAIDRNKKRIVFLKHDEIVNLCLLAKLNLDEDGKARIPPMPSKFPLSQEWADSLTEAIKSMEKVLDKISEDEE